MQVWDGSGTGQIHFSAASVHAEALGHIVENRVVQDALLERLHDCDMGLLANARLEQMRRSGDDWLLTLADGRTLRAPLVMAADGANSAVRRLTGCADARMGLPAPRHRHQRALLAAASSRPPGSASPMTARWRSCRWRATASRTGARSSGRPRRARPSA